MGRLELYFISDKDLDNQIIYPKIPSNYLTENGYEDFTTPRVSFAPTINQCLIALSKNLKDKYFNVYSPLGDYEIIYPTIDQVPDVEITDEIWICKPVQLQYIYSIHVIRCTNEYNEFKCGNKTAKLFTNWVYEICERKS